MNRHSPEPLTHEERELAQLIARTGPNGEPPTALDAKILAAAHAAANNKPGRSGKPRWPVAIGLAASMVLAVGIALQLRPVQPREPLTSEAPAIAAAETAPQAEAEAATEDAPPLHVDAITQDTAAADIPLHAPPPPPPAMAPSPSRTRAQPRRASGLPLPEAPPLQRQAQSADRYRSLNAAPTPPPAPAPVMIVPEPAAESPAAFAPDPRDEAGAGILSANEAAGYSAARTAAAKQSADREEAKAGTAIREQEGDTLDRIEVTGSRLRRTELQVPVSDDARLPVEEWLERVRTRYGLGDAGAAKRSLLLFVREHPSEAVPGDLEPLLEK